MTREGKYISMNLSDEDHKRAKVVAAKTGKTLKQIFLDAIAALEIKLAQEEKNKTAVARGPNLRQRPNLKLPVMEGIMAENSLSQAVSFINDNSTMEIGLTAEGQPAARSDIVAYHFQRNHKDVLRDIRKLRAKCPESFFERNFAPIEIEVKTGFGIRKDRAYLLTRDGFSLLVMGFTGAAAVRWKIRYIEAFNALEAAVAEDRASLARESGYLQGLDEGRAATKPEFLAARADAAARVWRFGPVKKRRLRSAVRYRRMGLGIAAIAKLLDVNNREISELLKAAEDLGFLSTDKPARPVQGNLLTLNAGEVEA